MCINRIWHKIINEGWVGIKHIQPTNQLTSPGFNWDNLDLSSLESFSAAKAAVAHGSLFCFLLIQVPFLFKGADIHHNSYDSFHSSLDNLFSLSLSLFVSLSLFFFFFFFFLHVVTLVAHPEPLKENTLFTWSRHRCFLSNQINAHPKC